MSLVLNLPLETESKVREAARSEGVDVSAYLREAAEARLLHFDPARKLTETELLERINLCSFPENFWSRFRALVAKSKRETLTLKEQQELIEHTSQTESRDAERLPYLAELAKRRGITIQAVFTELGLHPAGFD